MKIAILESRNTVFTFAVTKISDIGAIYWYPVVY